MCQDDTCLPPGEPLPMVKHQRREEAAEAKQSKKHNEEQRQKLSLLGQDDLDLLEEIDYQEREFPRHTGNIPVGSDNNESPEGDHDKVLYHVKRPAFKCWSEADADEFPRAKKAAMVHNINITESSLDEEVQINIPPVVNQQHVSAQTNRGRGMVNNRGHNRFISKPKQKNMHNKDTFLQPQQDFLSWFRRIHGFCKEDHRENMQLQRSLGGYKKNRGGRGGPRNGFRGRGGPRGRGNQRGGRG